MPRKPNYRFEKLQKEAAKAKRKAEKRARKKVKTDDEQPPAGDTPAAE